MQRSRLKVAMLGKCWQLRTLLQGELDESWGRAIGLPDLSAEQVSDAGVRNSNLSRFPHPDLKIGDPAQMQHVDCAK